MLLLGCQVIVVDDNYHLWITVESFFPCDYAPGFYKAIHDIYTASRLNQSRRHGVESSSEGRVFPAIVDKDPQGITGFKACRKSCEVYTVTFLKGFRLISDTRNSPQTQKVAKHVLDVDFSFCIMWVQLSVSS